MTTAVASPPNFQNISRLNWNGPNSGSGFPAMSSDEVSRLFMPQRKTVQRSNSSSSLSSNSSNSSTITITQEPETKNGPKKKARGGFWPVSKSESTASVTNARANGSLQTAIGNSLVNNRVQPALPSQSATAQSNAARIANGQTSEPAAILALLPMNGTFERKQISLPFYPEVLRIGRQTNAKTVPTPVNGYFDSKVLSRQHAEVWAERNGKVFIRDVKSSNGTFVNGQRLSPENRESEPHELRQHDTLELGIDIVSEDQKTIVHHKVSAKVEYVGLPGASNNVLDLSFGDLDPSHGGSILTNPVSTPMMHSRSRPGGPAVNGRASSMVSSNAGSQMSSAAQQRQMNFWGAPLNVEQLIKSLSTEMRAAQHQVNELEHAGTFLGSLLTTEGELKLQPPRDDKPKANGRPKPKGESVTRFSDPPVPPPQQPLPEKPDSAKVSPVNSTSFTNLLKRNDTTKPNAAQSPSSPQNSQMLSLIEALSIAKKELDSQGWRVKQLEEMLKNERHAREEAEERARKLEQHSAARPVAIIEEEAKDEVVESQSVEETSVDQREGEQQLQQHLDQVMAEMQRLKADMDKYQSRAESAEADAANARTSLAEMISKLREENEKAEAERAKDVVTPIEDDAEVVADGVVSKTITKWPSHANGHAKAPRLPEHLERAVTTVLQDRNPDALAQSGPYVSMVGVLLIGVGIMAYLNSWQKSER